MFVIDDLFAVGIGFDLAGGWLLAIGLLVRPELVWRRQTWDGIGQRSEADIEDRIVATFGLASLLTGFAVQAVGYVIGLAVDTDDSPSVARAITAGLLAIAPAVLVIVAERVTHDRRVRRFALAAALTDPEAQPQGLPSVTVLEMVAPMRGPRLGGESDRDYVRRVWQVDQVAERPDPPVGTGSPST